MASMTAQILVGNGDPYHGGIYPTHVLWLSENSRPAWRLEATGRDFRGVPLSELEGEEPPIWTQESIVWVPSAPEHILEDGILLVAVHVLCDEAVLARVEDRLPVLADGDFVELEKMPGSDLAELRAHCARSELDYKLVVTVLEGSSLEAQLPVLERYPMQVEVCTISYSRVWGGFVDRSEAQVRGSLTPRPGSGHRYHDVNPG